jgi:arginyl-tRNA synthetase
MKAHLQALLRDSLTAAFGEAAGTPSINIDAAKDAKHGDFATNLALAIAKPLGKPPRAVAEALVQHLPKSPNVSKVEIAGPGFINFFLARDAFQSIVRDILAAGESYGRVAPKPDQRVMVEFVSANPTGPLHVGHGRGAAYGDSLANILAATGWTVLREYYVNDAGRQVDVLALSVWTRYLQGFDDNVPTPARGYPGDYVKRTAGKLRDAFGEKLRRPAERVLRKLPSETLEAPVSDEQVKEAAEKYMDALVARGKELLGDAWDPLVRFAIADQLAGIRQTLDGLGVHFDRWYSERELVESGAADKARAQLRTTWPITSTRCSAAAS